jgi:hypothetical protein
MEVSPQLFNGAVYKGNANVSPRNEVVGNVKKFQEKLSDFLKKFQLQPSGILIDIEGIRHRPYKFF